MWHASVYLATGDLTTKEMIDDRKYNRSAISDDSLRYVELPTRAKSPFIDSENVPF